MEATTTITYPILIWTDTKEKSQLVLKDTNKPPRIINEDNHMSIPALIEEISKITDIPDLPGAGIDGDEAFFPFKVSEFNDDLIIWNTLLEDLKKEVENYKPHPDGTAEVQAELNRLYRLDLATSALEAVYDSIIYYMAALGNDLAVKSLGVSGILTTDNRFIKLLTANLAEHYEIVLL